MLELFDKILTEMKIVESHNKLVGVDLTGRQKRRLVIQEIKKYLRAKDSSDVIVAMLPFLIDLIMDLVNEDIDVEDLKRIKRNLDKCCSIV